MSLKPCTDCGEPVSSTAKACPKCGAKVPKTKWWLWAPLGLVGLLFTIGAITGPKTTTELGMMETERCMRNHGDGQWRGSSGVSLETFCNAKGALSAIKRACEIDPSKC